MKQDKQEDNFTPEFKQQVFAFHSDLHKNDRGIGGSIHKRVREQFGLTSEQVISIIDEMRATTPTNTIQEQKVLQDKLEVSPYKAGMIGVGFNDPKTSEGICQVFGANPNEKAELIVKCVNEHDKLIDTIKELREELAHLMALCNITSDGNSGFTVGENNESYIQLAQNAINKSKEILP